MLVVMPSTLVPMPCHVVMAPGRAVRTSADVWPKLAAARSMPFDAPGPSRSRSPRRARFEWPYLLRPYPMKLNQSKYTSAELVPWQVATMTGDTPSVLWPPEMLAAWPPLIVYVTVAVDD